MIVWVDSAQNVVSLCLPGKCVEKTCNSMSYVLGGMTEGKIQCHHQILVSRVSALQVRWVRVVAAVECFAGDIQQTHCG